MRFLLLCAALLAAAPAPAQARDEPRPITSGSPVTLYLHEGNQGATAGIVVGGGDTLRMWQQACEFRLSRPNLRA